MSTIRLDIPSGSQRLIDLAALRAWFQADGETTGVQVETNAAGGWSIVVETSNSGVVWAPWGDSAETAIATPTCSLQPRERPYLLATELARGACSRLRSLLGPAEASTSPDAAAARAELRRAALDDADPAAAQAAANVSLARFCALQDQALLESGRRRIAGGAAFELIVRQGLAAAEFVRGRRIAIRWRDVQPTPDAWRWDQVDRAFESVAGGAIAATEPLVVLGGEPTPDWAPNSPSAAAPETAVGYLEQLIARGAGRPIRWVLLDDSLAARGAGWSEEDVAQWAMAVAPELRAVLPEADLALRFRRLWDDHLREGGRISDRYFADLLLRSDAGISSLETVIAFGWDRGLSKPRDPTAVHAALSRWNDLGTPIHAVFAAPRDLEGGRTTPTPDQAAVWAAAAAAAGAASVAFDWPLAPDFPWDEFGEKLGFSARPSPG